MKLRIAVGSVLLCLAVSSSTRVAVAAGGFSESLSEKLVCPSGSTCTVVRTGTFKISGLAFEGQNLEPGEFNGSSVVAFELGDLSFNGTLSDDPKYMPGVSKSGTFVVTHTNSVTHKIVTDVKISLKPGASGVKISASGKISDVQPPILAGDYIGMIGSFTTNLSAFVQMGAHTENVNGTLGVVATVKTVIGKDGTTNDLSTVKIKAIASP